METCSTTLARRASDRRNLQLPERKIHLPQTIGHGFCRALLPFLGHWISWIYRKTNQHLSSSSKCRNASGLVKNPSHIRKQIALYGNRLIGLRTTRGTNQIARKALSTCVVYTNIRYSMTTEHYLEWRAGTGSETTPTLEFRKMSHRLVEEVFRVFYCTKT